VIEEDGNPIREMNKGLTGKRLETSSWSSREEFHRWEKKLIQNYVLRRLSLRSYARAELAKKLSEQGAENEIVQAVLDDYEKLGYLNDKEWLEAFIKGEERKGGGPAKIKQKLYMKGFSREAIEGLYDSFDPLLSLKNLIQKKIKNRNLSFEEKRKWQGYFLRRGYAFEDIKQLLSSFCKGEDSDN
jgi:regulatory protein